MSIWKSLTWREIWKFDSLSDCSGS